MRIYFCNCGKKIEVLKHEVKKCLCGKAYNNSGSISDYINMRKTWSGTTQVEFSQTTMDKDIAQRNRR